MKTLRRRLYQSECYASCRPSYHRNSDLSRRDNICFTRLPSTVIRLIVFSGIGLIHGLVPILTEPWQTRLNLPYEAHLEAAWFVVAGTLLLSLGANLASFFFHKPIANESATSFRILKSLEVQKPLRWFTVFAIAIGFITWVASVYFAGGHITYCDKRRSLRIKRPRQHNSCNNSTTIFRIELHCRIFCLVSSLQNILFLKPCLYFRLFNFDIFSLLWFSFCCLGQSLADRL